MIPLILCLVASVHDGDTLTCADGTRIRIAAINARELHGAPCPRDRPCPPMPAAAARDRLARIVAGRTIQCRQVGISYRRVVADCSVGGRNVGCAMVAAGAAAWWASYAARYNIRRCS